MIEIKKITKIYGRKENAFTALNDVSFEIQDGESVAIVGKSGSGKSTLMHAMSGLDKPQQGEVLVDGVDILKLSEKKTDEFRAKKMSFIFQSFFVSGQETCFENVSLPLEIKNQQAGIRKNSVQKALEAVDLLDKLNQKAKNLSGGQMQRLAIARAIANEPEILFADEPTGNLDEKTGAEVIDFLFSYCKKQQATLILVTHDLELAGRCDVQVKIKDGKIEKITRREASC